MIYELRTYTLRPGSTPTVAMNAGTVARDIRGDDYGKLEGYWLTEIGPLNQVMHLWSYESLNDRQKLRDALGKNSDWTGKYLPLILPHLLRQDIRLLQPLRALEAPAGGNHVYEFRNYRAQPGKIREWAKRFMEILPHRETFSKCVGIWLTEAGQPNEACHMWAYDSLDERMRIRAEVANDPKWQDFLPIASETFEEMNSTICIPAAHSPLQ